MKRKWNKKTKLLLRQGDTYPRVCIPLSGIVGVKDRNGKIPSPWGAEGVRVIQLLILLLHSRIQHPGRRLNPVRTDAEIAEAMHGCNHENPQCSG